MYMTEEELARILARNSSVKVHGELPSERKKAAPKQVAKKGKCKNEFQSLAEQKYYQEFIQPMELGNLLDHWTMHETFVVVDALEFQGIKFRKKVYTPDFMLYFRNGTVKAVEVKGEKIKKLQREYPLKKQLFIMKYCIPNGWDFIEVKAEDLTRK